jgi:hypothetical protein
MKRMAVSPYELAAACGGSGASFSSGELPNGS